MNSPTLINQFTCNTEGLGFDISVFVCPKELSLASILRCKSVHVDMQTKLVKEDDKEEYLRPLFVWDNLNINDFKAFDSKEKLFKYLEIYARDDEWPDFSRVFKKSTIEFENFFSNIPMKEAFLINKDWFSFGSDKVKEREFLSYGFYLLILWVDSMTNKLYICEWSDE